MEREPRKNEVGTGIRGYENQEVWTPVSLFFCSRR